MATPRRIAVLHDSPDFGGHEKAFLTWAPALLACPQVAGVHVRLPEANIAFQSALHAMAHLKLHVCVSPHVKRAGEPYRAPLRARYGRATAKFVEDVGADLVLMLQGRIENLATPMAWLPRSLEMVSYLPMAHSGVDMGRPRAVASFTDAVKRAYYARPQRLIVPSHAVAAQARRAGARGRIYVVENVPSPSVQPPPGRLQARTALGLDAGERMALFMGRFDVQQKGLDRLLRDIHAAGASLSAWRFLFVGQGPAEAGIRAALHKAAVSADIVGWTAEPELYMAASDVLLLPSRFEGTPLVMLEALRSGLPIFASDIDVYREYLPAWALFDMSRPVDLAAALERLTAREAVDAYRRHAAGACSRLDLEASRQAFLNGVLGDEPATSPAPVGHAAPPLRGEFAS